MFINATGFHVSEKRIDSQRPLELSGLTSEWIEQQTGIHARSKAKEGENTSTMSLEAVKDALFKLPYDITEVDLVVSVLYPPYDTIVTAAHTAQHEYTIANTKALRLFSACSSFLSALEAMEGYFTMGKISKALAFSADENPAHYNETDPKAGHLWDDIVAAFFISKERIGEGGAETVEAHMQGPSHLSKTMEAVHLRPRDDSILMPEGHDVFIQAYIYAPKNILYLLERDGYTLGSLTYFTGHQANMHIMVNIAKQLSLSDEEFLRNIEELGNTGSVNPALVYTQNDKNFRKDNLVIITVLDDGYSAGACLIKH